jgi:hypothetical protein
MRDKVQKTLEDVDNYEQSVNATLATLHIYKYDDTTKKIDASIKSWFGKKMNPGEITPDLLIQLDEQRGIITELKRSLPKNEGDKDLWKEEFDQLKKYDSDLKGWETPNKKITEQDLILLTSQKIGIHVNDYIDEKNLSFKDFSKEFAVLQFNPASGIKQAVFLQKIKGKVTDYKKITNDRLRTGITVSLEYLLMSGLSKIKFIDVKPNIVYLMSIMWDFVFSSIPTEEDWRTARESKGGKIVEISIDVDDVRTKLNQNFTINGDNGVVKNEWVKEALENFVKIKLAKRNVTGYSIKYRKKIKDEGESDNKHKVFADLLFKEGVQTSLEEHY